MLFRSQTPLDLASIVKKEGIKRVGIEGDSLSFNSYNLYKSKLENAELIDVSSCITELRQVKDQWELEQIREAQRITDLAFEHILGYLSTDITETDVTAELEYFMRKHGAEDKSFETISISAEKTSLPHGRPSPILSLR